MKDAADQQRLRHADHRRHAKAIGGGRWDGGWIYDPEVKRKYSVELTAISAGQLKVIGYHGIEDVQRDHDVARAPADLKRCNA